MPAKIKPKHPLDIAVIDIGSNSVRLAIYRVTTSGHEVIHEKKATCGLARGMTHRKPRLDRKGMRLTLKTLRKFNRILKKRKPQKVFAIGTAAMRAVIATRKGKAFRRSAEQALGHKIDVISGRKEARLTAYGVMGGLPRAAGVCGDLGGGSLELASIKSGRVRHTVTLPLGSLTLATESGHDPIRAEQIMLARLNQVKWLGRLKGKTFYPIGGSWRAVARVMIKKSGKSVKIVHGYTIKAGRARKYAEAMAETPPAKFRKMHKKIRHRAGVIPYAAAVLAEIIIRMRPARITFSGRGVREGVVREAIG
jgi:exopolyphosphatase/guanosine-5'-triphosphate,3'-diphosphate pyrophosphatase